MSSSLAIPTSDSDLARARVRRAGLLQRLQVTCDRQRRAELEHALVELDRQLAPRSAS